MPTRRQVRGALPRDAEEVARVIERHQDHDRAADEVHGVDPSSIVHTRYVISQLRWCVTCLREIRERANGERIAAREAAEIQATAGELAKNECRGADGDELVDEAAQDRSSNVGRNATY